MWNCTHLCLWMPFAGVCAGAGTSAMISQWFTAAAAAVSWEFYK